MVPNLDANGFGDSQVESLDPATDVEVQISEFVFGVVGAFLRGHGVALSFQLESSQFVLESV